MNRQVSVDSYKICDKIRSRSNEALVLLAASIETNPTHSEGKNRESDSKHSSCGENGI